jgi:hypothetical protein
MKLRTFLGLAALGLTGVGVLLYLAFSGGESKQEAKPVARPVDQPVDKPVDKPVDPPPVVTDPPPVAANTLRARSYDAEVLAMRTRKLSSEKAKDVTKGKPYKVNLYQDAGKPTVNRAKIDLDRDDKFDEKYTFDGDVITLQRAPADDEQYTETFHWTGDAWLPEGAEAITPAPPTDFVESSNTLAARAHDAAVLAYRGKAIGTDKIKDASKGKPYKINVYQDAGKPTANRAKVDLDRDDKWDEKYTFDGDTVTLEISPNEDESYPDRYHWSGDGWASAK